MLLQVTISKDDKKKLVQLAEEKRLSVSALARLLIFERVDQIKKETDLNG